MFYLHLVLSCNIHPIIFESIFLGFDNLTIVFTQMLGCFSTNLAVWRFTFVEVGRVNSAAMDPRVTNCTSNKSSQKIEEVIHGGCLMIFELGVQRVHCFAGLGWSQSALYMICRPLHPTPSAVTNTSSPLLLRPGLKFLGEPSDISMSWKHVPSMNHDENMCVNAK